MLLKQLHTQHHRVNTKTYRRPKFKSGSATCSDPIGATKKYANVLSVLKSSEKNSTWKTSEKSSLCWKSSGKSNNWKSCGKYSIWKSSRKNVACSTRASIGPQHQHYVIRTSAYILIDNSARTPQLHQSCKIPRHMRSFYGMSVVSNVRSSIGVRHLPQLIHTSAQILFDANPGILQLYHHALLALALVLIIGAGVVAGIVIAYSAGKFGKLSTPYRADQQILFTANSRYLMSRLPKRYHHSNRRGCPHI